MVQRQGLENSFIPAEVSSILVIFLMASLMDMEVIFMKMEKFSFVENGITENFLRVNYSLQASFQCSFQVINSKSILDGAVVHDYKIWWFMQTQDKLGFYFGNNFPVADKTERQCQMQNKNILILVDLQQSTTAPADCKY